jgi:hypothetical protein
VRRINIIKIGQKCGRSCLRERERERVATEGRISYLIRNHKRSAATRFINLPFVQLARSGFFCSCQQLYHFIVMHSAASKHYHLALKVSGERIGRPMHSRSPRLGFKQSRMRSALSSLLFEVSRILPGTGTRKLQIIGVSNRGTRIIYSRHSYRVAWTEPRVKARLGRWSGGSPT